MDDAEFERYPDDEAMRRFDATLRAALDKPAKFQAMERPQTAKGLGQRERRKREKAERAVAAGK